MGNHRLGRVVAVWLGMLLVPWRVSAGLDEDFATGLDAWNLVVYDSAGGSAADPGPLIDSVMGLPAPSADVNGNSSCGNGMYSKEVFDYEEGMVIEWDMYVASGHDWNWGFGGLASHLPRLVDQRSDGVWVDDSRCDTEHLAAVRLIDDGAFGTAPPSLTLLVATAEGTNETWADDDATDLLDAWHHWRIAIRWDGLVDFVLDGAVLWTSTQPMDQTRGELPVLFGGRDASGPVRIDNVSVTRCTPSPTNLCLNDGRFRVNITWRDFIGNTGTGRIVPYGSDDSGMFWFFHPDNWEVLIKVLDGCHLNNHYWVFAAATTNVEYTLTVTDTERDISTTYFNGLGVASPAITDTTALDTCP